jgi:hypothetical protein
MPPRVQRILLRFAAALLLLGIFTLMTRGLGLGGDRSLISIDFGSDPEQFEGLAVVIDDQVAGTLQRSGRAARTGFQVPPGRHSVRVVHPDHASVPAVVAAGAGQGAVNLTADFGNIALPDGRNESAVVLTR